MYFFMKDEYGEENCYWTITKTLMKYFGLGILVILALGA